VLPTLAAGALVVTATGATYTATADATPLTLDLNGSQTAMARTEQAADEAMVTDLAQRRQASGMGTAALQGRVEEQARAARDAKRKVAAEAKAVRANHRWVRPIHSWHITSGFGWRWGKTHDGIDLGAATGTPLYAMSKGTVIGSFYDASFGNKLEIKYWDGSISWYGHLSRRIAEKGDTVLPGELVGLVGDTGHSFGSHLHLELQKTTVNDSPVDPMPWLRLHGLL
jgi:murein DD-endopeptidase MepM/ murein hydrolase activator NlpD